MNEPKTMVELWDEHNARYECGPTIVKIDPKLWPKLGELLQKALDTNVPLTDKKARELLGLPPAPEGVDF